MFVQGVVKPGVWDCRHHAAHFIAACAVAVVAGQGADDNLQQGCGTASHVPLSFPLFQAGEACGVLRLRRP